MRYEKNYVFQWTYRNPNSKNCYTETKHFDTELERNKFALEWFSKARQGEIILEFAQERDLKTWRK